MVSHWRTQGHIARGAKCDPSTGRATKRNRKRGQGLAPTLLPSNVLKLQHNFFCTFLLRTGEMLWVVVVQMNSEVAKGVTGGKGGLRWIGFLGSREP